MLHQFGNILQENSESDQKRGAQDERAYPSA